MKIDRLCAKCGADFSVEFFGTEKLEAACPCCDSLESIPTVTEPLGNFPSWRQD